MFTLNSTWLWFAVASALIGAGRRLKDSDVCHVLAQLAVVCYVIQADNDLHVNLYGIVHIASDAAWWRLLTLELQLNVDLHKPYGFFYLVCVLPVFLIDPNLALNLLWMHHASLLLVYVLPFVMHSYLVWPTFFVAYPTMYWLWVCMLWHILHAGYSYLSLLAFVAIGFVLNLVRYSQCDKATKPWLKRESRWSTVV